MSKVITKPKAKKENILKSLTSRKNLFWMNERKKQMLDLFHRASQFVPAYKDFLRKHKVQPEKIKTLEDFQQVPRIDKKNYLKHYSFEKLHWEGSFKKSSVLTATSGSTGEPCYFARNDQIDRQSSIIHELFLNNTTVNPKEPTLVIVGFGMGVWIGGLITYQAFKIIGENSYPISIITPGSNKEEIFKVLDKIAPHFSQVILTGYPPFIKDVLDEASDRGIKIKKLNIKLLFATEMFTEKFRDYVSKKVGISNPLLQTTNIYGSADIGTMAHETPLSILVRRITLKNKKLFNNLFPSTNKIPTLVQYIPSFINFESQDNEILLTGNSSIPLIRYAIGDQGGVFSFDELNNKLFSSGISLYKEAKNVGIEKKIYQLPFVYIYERSDMSTKLYGAVIYAEYITVGLQNNGIQKYITGKFSMFTKHDKNQNEYLEINIELKPGITESDWLVERVTNSVVNSLLKKSAEYKYLAAMLNDKVRPKITFWPAGDPTYFKSGVKQKWVKK